MAQTYTYFILILLAWGLWGFFAKYALKFISPFSLIIFQTIGSIIFEFILLLALLYSRNKFETDAAGISFAMLTALFGIIGAVIFFFTLSKTKASILVPLTALYPIVTVVIGFILLKEKITLIQGIGILLAVAAGVLLSI